MLSKIDRPRRYCAAALGLLFATFATPPFAAADSDPPGTTQALSNAPVSTSEYSDCVLSEIAKLEGTTVTKLSNFSKTNANRAISTCQSTKAQWVAELDRQYAADQKYQDARLRNAAVNQIVSTDELSVLLMINLKAR
jgi:hypothetical protein